MPRLQQRLLIDKATGDATVTTEVLPDTDLAGRIAGLKATIPAAMDITEPGTVRRVTLRCDGCGVTAALDWDDPRRPDGWTERDDGDYCPACGAAAGQYKMSVFNSATTPDVERGARVTP